MATKKTEQTGTVKARVLVNGAFGAVDNIVEVDAQVAQSSADLDANPEAVAYAQSLKAE